MKKVLTIQERDWSNYLERRKRGFRNRQEERSFQYPKRKYNCRKLTRGRINWRKDVYDKASIL